WLLQRQQVVASAHARGRLVLLLRNRQSWGNHLKRWGNRATWHSSSKRLSGRSTATSSTTGARAPVFTLRSYRGVFTSRCSAQPQPHRAGGEIVICRAGVGDRGSPDCGPRRSRDGDALPALSQ